MTVETLTKASALANAISTISGAKNKDGEYIGLEITHRCKDQTSNGVGEIRHALANIHLDYANQYIMALEAIKADYTRLTDQVLENLKKEFENL
jgi:hypothetical protein